MRFRILEIIRIFLFLLVLQAIATGYSYGQNTAFKDSLIDLAKNSEVDSLRVKALHSLSNPGVSNTDQIMDYAQQALDLSRRNNWKGKEALSLMLLGNAYHEKGDYPQSIDYYWEAVRLFEETGNKNFYARTLTNIASIYNYEASYAKALETFEKALAIAREIQDGQMESGILVNMGSSYTRSGDTAKAIALTNEASRLAQESGDIRTLRYAYNNLSVLYAHQRKYDKAIELQRKIINSTDKSDNYLMSLACINMVSLFREKKDFDSALYFAHQALDHSNQHGSESRISQVYENLATLYMAIGDSAAALNYYMRADKIKEELFNQENSREIVELTQKYENEKAVLRMERLRIVRQSFIAFSIILMIFLIWVFVQYKKVKRQNALLTQKSLREAQNEELFENDASRTSNEAADAKSEAFTAIPPAKEEEIAIEDNTNLEWIHKELKRQMRSKKLFLDPALNLEKLGRSIGTNRTYLSQCINQNYGGFNSYINKLRINEFIRIASKKKKGSFTIEEIALTCGFASISPFRAAFKKSTGLSPRVFLANLDKEDLNAENN